MVTKPKVKPKAQQLRRKKVDVGFEEGPLQLMLAVKGNWTGSNYFGSPQKQ